MQKSQSSATPAAKSRATTAAESVAGGPTPARTDAWKDDPEAREVLIRLAAYSFYERRGYVSGHELEDWLEAEMEIDRQPAGDAKPDETY